MTDLMAGIEDVVKAKSEAQQAYIDALKNLSDEQLEALTVVATEDASAAMSELNGKIEAGIEAHPFGIYLAEQLGQQVGDAYKTINDRLWEICERNNRLFQRTQDVMSGPLYALVFGDMLSEEEREEAFAPWRAALGDSAGI